MTNQTATFEILFLANGSAILQVNENEFVHYYDSMEQLAADVRTLVEDPDISDWEGHEPEMYVGYDNKARNSVNGYRVFDEDDWMDAEPDSDWPNIREFAAYAAQ